MAVISLQLPRIFFINSPSASRSLDASSIFVMEAEINDDFLSLQPAKPTNTLKKTRRKGGGRGCDHGMMMWTGRNGEEMQGGNEIYSGTTMNERGGDT